MNLPENMGWIVATVDHHGKLHIDWDGELHTDYEAAVREAEACVEFGWPTQLLYAHRDPSWSDERGRPAE